MKIAAGFLVCITIMAMAVMSSAEVVDKIAVVVNNEIITQGEIDRLMAPLYEEYRKLYRGPQLIKKLEEERQKIIQQLIEERLILCEAKKLNIEVDDREVEDKIKESIRRFGSRENFEEAIKQQHITMRDLRTRYKEQIMNRRLVDQKVGANITITPTEVQNYYNSNPGQFARQEEVRLRNILIRPKSDSDAPRALSQAKELAKRLKDGCDFGGLAKIYSEGPMAQEGGLMGYSKRGDLLPEIEKAVFSLKTGEMTGIVQTRSGYHIFKVEERLESKTMPLSEIRQDVEEMLFRVKVEKKIKGWVEGLKKNAYIAFK